jgi:hypothetical protein
MNGSLDCGSIDSYLSRGAQSGWALKVGTAPPPPELIADGLSAGARIAPILADDPLAFPPVQLHEESDLPKVVAALCLAMSRRRGF